MDNYNSNNIMRRYNADVMRLRLCYDGYKSHNLPSYHDFRNYSHLFIYLINVLYYFRSVCLAILYVKQPISPDLTTLIINNRAVTFAKKL